MDETKGDGVIAPGEFEHDVGDGCGGEILEGNRPATFGHPLG
jgi:hypothetical protein